MPLAEAVAQCNLVQGCAHAYIHVIVTKRFRLVVLQTSWGWRVGPFHTPPPLEIKQDLQLAPNQRLVESLLSPFLSTVPSHLLFSS